MTQSEVEALLPVITPFSVPDLMDTLYEVALAQFTLDASACLGTSAENTAITYYIAGMLSSGAGSAGVISEKIDDYAIKFGEGGQAAEYENKYRQIVDTCNYHAAMVGISTEITREDTLDDLDLDAAGIVSVDGDEEFI